MENPLDDNQNTQPDPSLTLGPITPRPYQWAAYNATAQHIRTSTAPAFVEGSVGSGKTIMIGMICKRAQDAGMSALILARQGELVDQNSEELWRMGVKHSIYSASLGKKSTLYPIICGTEGTVARALNGDLADFAPTLLLIDESHMVDWQDAMQPEPTSQYAIIIKTLQQRNPKIRIIGYTGSPYRGIDPILGDFWKKRLVNFGTHWLVEQGYLVPQIFGYGHDDVQYDLSEFAASRQDGTQDFTAEQMRQMEKKILDSHTTTQKIMMEVEELAKDRNGVLITCAGKKHCEEAVHVLPEGSYGIVTDQTAKKTRAQILKDAKSGRLKYVLQIGCLTTGVNIPRWDTIVILRKIGSLTLLTQLIGRGLRLPEPDGDYAKEDCLILDYSSTMQELGQLYHSPILEKAELQRARQMGDLITCPRCGTGNSPYARRCIGESAATDDGRCDYFWLSKTCENCGTPNDTAARECRKCDAQLIDPNANLSGKYYTDDDLQNVVRMDMGLTKNQQGVLVTYHLESGEKATEVFWPSPGNHISRKIWKMKFVFKHVQGSAWRQRALSLTSATAVVNNRAMFDVPKQITHRKNGKGRDVIHRKVFLSGREYVDNNDDNG